MKFGVCLPHRWNYSSKKNISRIAVRAEELGFDSLWVTDHIIVPETHLERGDTFFEALTTLSFVAGMTENILLGTAVLGVSPREPILLAKQIATIDALSEGRFILGVGTGWIEEELQTLNQSWVERGSILDESLQVAKILWQTEGPVSFSGKYTNFSDMLFNPKPHNKNGPPIWIGGMKTPSLKRAAKVGDGWFPWAVSPDEIREGVKKLEGFRREFGRRNPFSISCFMPTNLEPSGVRRYRGFFEEEHFVLSGGVAEVHRTLEDFSDAGLEHLALSFKDVRLFKEGTISEIEAQMEEFAKDVMPSHV